MIEIIYPCNKFSSRRGVNIDCIVIHDTVGNFPGCLTWLAARPPLGSEESSVHVLINKLGEIYRLVPDEFKAWHAGDSILHGRSNVNYFSLGVELERKKDDTDDFYTKAQLESAAEWVSEKCTQYHIPLNRVVGHADIAPGRKIDPRKFDWVSFLMGCAGFKGIT